MRYDRLTRQFNTDVAKISSGESPQTTQSSIIAGLETDEFVQPLMTKDPLQMNGGDGGPSLQVRDGGTGGDENGYPNFGQNYIPGNNIRQGFLKFYPPGFFDPSWLSMGMNINADNATGNVDFSLPNSFYVSGTAQIHVLPSIGFHQQGETIQGYLYQYGTHYFVDASSYISGSASNAGLSVSASNADIGQSLMFYFYLKSKQFNLGSHIEYDLKNSNFNFSFRLKKNFDNKL